MYKQIDDGFVICISEGSPASDNQIPISAEEYNMILEKIANKPHDTETVIYKLIDGTLTYEPFEVEPPTKPSNPYGIDDGLYNSIIDEYTLMLIEEGVIE